MKFAGLLRGPLGLLGLVLVLQGCAPTSVERERTVNEVIKSADRKAQEPQWVQFGVVEWIRPTTIERENGGTEAAMELNILMDNGEGITVTQAVSQAGRFNVGNRVRLLHIGDFTRITYWPYVPQAPQGEASSGLPDSGG